MILQLKKKPSNLESALLDEINSRTSGWLVPLKSESDRVKILSDIVLNDDMVGNLLKGDALNKFKELKGIDL